MHRQAEYLVTWQQMGASAGDWNIRGRILHADGSAGGPAFDIAVGAKAQTLPAASYSLSDTAYLVTWQQYVDGTSLNDVLGRRVSVTGTLEGITISIAAGSDDQRAPDLAYSNARGEFLVSWEQQAMVGLGSWDLLARRVSGEGTVGSAFAVSNGALDERYPAVAYDAGASQYVIAWQDYRSGSSWDIYAQRVETDGDLRGDEALVGARPESYTQRQAAAAYGSAQGLHLVVWTDGRNGTNDVYGQLVTGGGALVGSPVAIANSASDSEQSPAAAYDPVHDEYLVTWVRGAPMTEHQIRARRVDADGALLGAELEIRSAGLEVDHPAVAYHAALGYFLITWEDSRNGTWDVYARAVSGGSGDLAREFVVAGGADDQRTPDVAADTGGAYLVVWQDQGGEASSIAGQRVTTTQGIGNPFAIAEGGSRERPAAAFNPELQEYLVLWEEDNGSDDDVRGRRVSADGKLAGEELALATGAAEQQYPAVAANGAGGWAAAWQQGSSGADVHARVLDGAGRALGGEETLSSATNSQEGPALSYDVGRGRFLAVWTDYRNSGTYPDIYGQLYRGYSVVIDYAYDPLHRLTEAGYSTGVQFGYEYDTVGNRTALTETSPVSGTIVTEATFDAANQLTHRARSDGWSYQYDWSERGELLAERTRGQAVRSFSWDAAGQLVGATVFTTTTHFTYTGDGVRTVVAVEGGAETHYISNLGGQVLVEDTGVTTTRYLYGYGCLGEVRAGTPAYYLADGQGYVRQTADASGAVVDAWLYTPGGGIMSGPAGPVSHLVCGGIYDESTGLIYRGGRYFDPTLGIYMAMGPLAVIGGWKSMRKGGRRRAWSLLFLLIGIILVGGILAGCNVCVKPSTICVDDNNWEPFPNPIGDRVLFVNPEPGNAFLQRLPDAGTLIPWNPIEKDFVRFKMTESLSSHYGGPLGFGGGLENALSRMGFSRECPLWLFCNSIRNDSMNAQTGRITEDKGLYTRYITAMILYRRYFENNKGGPNRHVSTITHELAHYWDIKHSETLSNKMVSHPLQGKMPTTPPDNQPNERFAAGVESYFHPETENYLIQRNAAIAWTDDRGLGFGYYQRWLRGEELPRELNLGFVGPDIGWDHDIFDYLGTDRVGLNEAQASCKVHPEFCQ